MNPRVFLLVLPKRNDWLPLFFWTFSPSLLNCFTGLFICKYFIWKMRFTLPEGFFYVIWFGSLMPHGLSPFSTHIFCLRQNRCIGARNQWSIAIGWKSSPLLFLIYSEAKSSATTCCTCCACVLKRPLAKIRKIESLYFKLNFIQRCFSRSLQYLRSPQPEHSCFFW